MMKVDNKQSWEYKYRPTKLDDLILDAPTKEVLRSMVDNHALKNLLISGKPGIGKTTLAEIIVSELNCARKFIDGSVNNNVDMVRGEVKGFCERNAGGRLKVVIIDEAEELSNSKGSGSSAQSALKNVIDASENDTRFILTCNDSTRIIEAVQSRCTKIFLKYEKKDVLRRCATILKEEGIKFDRETLLLFGKEVVVDKFPDIRSIVATLELWCTTGTLLRVSESIGQVDAVVEFILGNIKQPQVVRQYLLDNDIEFGQDYINLCGKVFNTITDFDTLIVVSENLYRMNNVINPEIQFYTMLIQLSRM